MLSISGNNKVDVIEAFNSTLRYTKTNLIFVVLILKEW